MLVTVTTSNQDLKTILSDPQEAIWEATRQDRIQKVLIQNLWTPDIYVDFWTASAVASWIKIAQDSSFAFEDVELSDCNLISDTSNNTNVRIIIN